MFEYCPYFPKRDSAHAKIFICFNLRFRECILSWVYLFVCVVLYLCMHICMYLFGNVRLQARIQRLKEVSQTGKIPVFPLADVWVSKYTSVITCIALPTLVRWFGAHQCKISWKLHPNTSNTDLQTLMKNIAAHQTRSILANTRNSHSHMLYKIGILKSLAKFKENYLC